MMENFNSHIAVTVKSAIKQKLLELGTYVDDELPDYIMVLVVNKKSKEQMDNDLSLFLGHNTEHFTSWLTGVLEQLHDAAAAKATPPAKAVTHPPAASAITPPAVEKEISKDLPDEVKKQEPGKTDTAAPKDKKKSKEKKKEKKERKKKKKEKKDLEKSLRREAKKKAAAENFELLNKSSIAAISKAMEVTGNKVGILDEKVSSIVAKDPPSSEKKRKRHDSESGASDNNEEDLSTIRVAKKMVLDGKNLKITKTITNDKVKEKTEEEEKEGQEEKKIEKLPLENFKITTTQDIPSTTTKPEPIKTIGDLLMHAEDEIELQEEIIEEEEILEEEEEVAKDKMVSSSISRSKNTSVMDRLGPRSKRSEGRRSDSDSENRKKRSRSDGLSSHKGKATASVAPSKRLEARVRPLSVIERSNTEHSPERMLSSVISRDSDNESEIHPSVASKIEMSSSGRRNTGRSREANTNLILRAVADANKSVTTSSKRTLSDDEDSSRVSEKTKKKKLEVFSRSYRERERSQRDKLQKLSITVPNNLEETEEIEYEEEEMPPHIQSRLGVKVPSSSQYVIMEENQPLVRSRLTNTHGNVEEYIEEVEEWEEDIESLSGQTVRYVTPAGVKVDPISLSLDQLIQKDPKYQTRCSYWPACRTGEKCPYKHPSLPCKMFPSCSFGDKCLYIHPNCKFDALCTRANCPYTHASPRNGSATAAAAAPAPITLPPPGKTKLVLNAAAVPRAGTIPRRCMFGSHCKNAHCTFTHPKPCRFGSSCLTPGCLFSHPDFSTGNKLKWVAPAKTPTTAPTSVGTVTTSVGAVPTPTAAAKVVAAKNGVAPSAIDSSPEKELNVIMPSQDKGTKEVPEVASVESTRTEIVTQ